MWSTVTSPPASATLNSSLVASLIAAVPLLVTMLRDVTEPSVPRPGAPNVANPAIDSTLLPSACDVIVTPGMAGGVFYWSSAGPPGKNVSALNGSFSAGALSLRPCGTGRHCVGTLGSEIGRREEHSWPSCWMAEPKWPARSPGQTSDERPWPSGPLSRLAEVSGMVASSTGWAG